MDPLIKRRCQVIDLSSDRPSVPGSFTLDKPLNCRQRKTESDGPDSRKARPGEPERAIADIEGPRLTRHRRELLGVLTRIDAATISQSGLIAEPDGSTLGRIWFR